MKTVRFGDPLNAAETAILLALRAGYTTHLDIALHTNYSIATMSNTMHVLRKKAGARNMVHLALMIGGVVPCPRNILSVLNDTRGNDGSPVA